MDLFSTQDIEAAKRILASRAYRYQETFKDMQTLEKLIHATHVKAQETFLNYRKHSLIKDAPDEELSVS